MHLYVDVLLLRTVCVSVFLSICSRDPVSPLFDCVHLVQVCCVNSPRLQWFVRVSSAIPSMDYTLFWIMLKTVTLIHISVSFPPTQCDNM